MRYITLTSALPLVLSLSQVSHGQEPKVSRSRMSDQTQLSLTVYSNGRAVVRDRRKVQFEKGRFFLELQDVSGQMRAETAQFKSLTSANDVSVLEQNLEFDLLSPQKMLEKYLGRTVSVIRTHPTTGIETAEPAEVLAVQNGVVLKMKDRIETGTPGRMVFPEVPSSLRAEPTLSLLLESKRRGEQDVELNYLTDGLTWKADYIAELNGEEDRIQLSGLVTLTNRSGTSFRQAQLQLMGGDVRTVDSGNFNQKRALMAYSDTSEMEAAQSASVAVSGDSFFEYHLYTMPRPTSIMSNQTKQITLLQASDVAARKELVFVAPMQNYFAPVQDEVFAEESENDPSPDDAELGFPLNGDVFLVFENNKESRIGMPLPAGTVRVYKKDKAAALQFVGEDKIRHVPESERVRVQLGRSFDVSARRKRMGMKTLTAKKYLFETESTVRVTFKNAKATSQKVAYRESFPGNWKIVSTSHENNKLNKDVSEWQLTVPAKGQSVLNFKVKVSTRR